MQVEISQLELRYAQLRIRDAAQRSKLLASLAQDGQQSPVMVVVAEAAERYVLIDGYARVEVLRELARDVVVAHVDANMYIGGGGGEEDLPRFICSVFVHL